MTEEQLRSMTEKQIRARFRCAPAYYLQAKLEKKRALEKLAIQGARDAESRWLAALAERLQRRAAQHAAPDPGADPDPEHAQQTILEAAPEGYSSRPLLPGPESETEPDLAPESQPEIAPAPVPDNVTGAGFGRRAPRAVRVVSVIMDRKRPNMVRVVGETTHRAS